MDKRSDKEVFHSFKELAVAVQGEEEVERKMSKLNQKNASPRHNHVEEIEPELALSAKGNVQYKKGPEQALYEALVMTLIGKDSYHEDQTDRMERVEAALVAIVAKGNLDFIANAIIYARTEMNIRSMPVVLTGLFAKAVREAGVQYPQMRRLVTDVIQRADQIADMYAVAFMVFGNKKSVPMAIKRGVADAFNKFNEYGFAKYNRNGVVKLRDVLRIVHPIGKDDEQKAVFDRLMKDALEVPYTWEVELSKNGQLPENERKNDAKIWQELVASNKLGYMALLRNLRNMLKANVNGDTRTAIVERLADPEQVAKSKQLPFRFVSAIDAISEFNDNRFNKALYDAVDHSLGNIPKIGDRVWVIIDCSGSMGGHTHPTFETVGNRPIRTAALLAGGLARAHAGADKLAITVFSDDAKHVNINPNDSVLGIAQKVINSVYGGGTNLQAALDMKSELGFEPDTVFVLSDMQVDCLRDDYRGYGWHHSTEDRGETSKKATDIFVDSTIKVAVNLEGYASTPVHESHGWLQVSGWSDKIFDFVPALRDGKSVVDMLSKPYTSKEAA